MHLSSECFDLHAFTTALNPTNQDTAHSVYSPNSVTHTHTHTHTHTQTHTHTSPALRPRHLKHPCSDSRQTKHVTANVFHEGWMIHHFSHGDGLLLIWSEKSTASIHAAISSVWYHPPTPSRRQKDWESSRKVAYLCNFLKPLVSETCLL